MSNILKFCEVGHKIARLRKKLKGQETEDVLAFFTAIFDLVVAIAKIHFGLFDILDVFSVSQDFMTIG